MTGDLFPGRAAISRLVNSATRAGDWRIGVIGWPAHIPKRGVDGARVIRIEGQVDGAGVFILGKDSRPGLAAIRSAIDPALSVRSKAMTECGDEHNIRILWINQDPADLSRIAEADVRPGHADVD